MDKSVLKNKQVGELREIAEALQLKGYKSLKKADLIDLIASGGGPSTNGDEESPSSKSSESKSSDATEDVTSADRIRARRRGGAQDDQPSASEADRSDRESSGDEPRGRQRVREERSSDRSNDRSNDRSDDRSDDGGDDDNQSRSRSRNRSRNRKGGRNQDIDFDELEVRQGVLDLLPEGYGFLRTSGYLAGDRDVYVSQAFVRRNQLRRGDVLAGPIRFNKGNDKFPALARIDSVEGVDVDPDARPEARVDFKDLTPVHPTQRLRLDTGKDTPASLRILDLLAPIGLGQRGLVIAPPQGGRTTLLKHLASAIEQNHPDVHLMVLLLDERPEDVTDFTEATNAEVISSAFDHPAEDHAQASELTIERAKRVVEHGKDVVVLVDSLTHLARAHNLTAPGGGRQLPGGLDASAVHPVKRFFGAARKVAEGGSLTMVATALVETGSGVDEAIFEQLRGTGNMEVRFDRALSRQRSFPAIDVTACGTRRDDLLLDGTELEAATKLRRAFASMDPAAALALLLDKVESTDSNAQLVKAIAKSDLG